MNADKERRLKRITLNAAFTRKVKANRRSKSFDICVHLRESAVEQPISH